MKHLLLALIGRSPQVITESIYALQHQKGIVIDELWVVTTQSNRENTYKALSSKMSNGLSPLENYAQHYSTETISFTPEHINVPLNKQGQPINDVTSAEEMIAVSEYLLRLVREFTSKQDICLHASLAGGRKTMTFYLSYAMSIYGRTKDTLSHVFVDSAFEKTNFFYPTPNDQAVIGTAGTLNARNATVTLAEIPFIQLRPLLPETILQQDLSFDQVKTLYQAAGANVELIVDIPQKIIRCSGIDIPLSPANFAFYLIMVEDALSKREGFDIPTQTEPDTTLAAIYLGKRLELLGLKNDFKDLEETLEYADKYACQIKSNELESLRQGFKKHHFTARKKEINDAIRKALPRSTAEHYDIDKISKKSNQNTNKPAFFYGLNVELSAVVIKN